MSLPRHVIFALIYGVIAIAVALTLPYSVPSMEKWTAVAIGALVLTFGAVLHEVYSRQVRERDVQREMAHLAVARDDVLGELARARAEVRAIQGQLLQRTKGEQTLGRVKDEVRLLQGLVSRLSDPPAGRGTARGPVRQAPRPLVPAGSLADDDIVALLRDALRHDRIDMALQPIVSLPQRKPRHYEALCRIRDAAGAHLQAGAFIGLAEREGLVATIDNILLFRCVQLVRESLRRHSTVGFFVNVSIHTLADRLFMAQFVEFMAGNRELSSRLVFEIGTDDFFGALDVLRGPIEVLGQLGFRFSLDKARALVGLDAGLLEQCHVRFLKIDVNALLADVRDPESPLDIDAVKQAFERASIDLIVDRVETEQALVEVLDLPIDYGQGVLFGEPREI
ncbi:MAG: EAL domain-containing protein [Alphaproteobacteria bacterium]